MKFCGNSPQKGGLVHQKGGRGEGKRSSRQMYDTETYQPSFPPVSVRKIPRKYQPIPNRNTKLGCNSMNKVLVLHFLEYQNTKCFGTPRADQNSSTKTFFSQSRTKTSTKTIELYPNSVFRFGISWYFPGIFPTDTEGKLGGDVLVLDIWREPLFSLKRRLLPPF